MSAPPPPAPLVDRRLLINSVAVWLVTVAFFAYLSWSLFRRGFIRNTYLSDTSSLRFILHRTRLLFTLSCLGIVDALNHAIFHFLVWETNSYPGTFFWIHRTITALIFPLLLPAGVLALSYRCASVITSNKRWRERYVLCATVICAAAGVVQVTGGFVMMLAQKDWSPAAKISPLTRWFSPWGNYGQIVLPVLAIVGSMLSIRKVAAQRKRKRAKSLRVLAKRLGRPEKHRQMTESGSASNSMAGTQPSTPAASQNPASFEAAQPSTSKTTPLHDPVSTVATTPSASGLGRASYPLTLSFQALNVAVLINWTASGLLTAAQTAGQVRIQAWLSLLIALSVASEASFERLTKYYNRRRRENASAGPAQGVDDPNESMFRGVATVNVGQGNPGPVEAGNALKKAGREQPLKS